MKRFIIHTIFSLALIYPKNVLNEIELLDIYTTENDLSYSLVMEFDGSEVNYITRELYSPPTITVLLKNVTWNRGDFTRESAHNPLYQYRVETYGDHNLVKDGRRVRVRMRFNSIPVYHVDLLSHDPKTKLVITWKKKEKDHTSSYVSSPRRLPESKVSLNLKGADLLDVVRLLASQDDLNLVLGGDVSGSVSLRLQDVTLETALDAILHVNGFDWFLQENIIIVKPSEGESVLSGELDTRIYRLRYIKGTMIADAMEDVLTGRGRVKPLSSTQSSDEKEKVDDIVMITDVPTNFFMIEKIINTLDQEGAQINIAVKFIETTLKHDETIGINWNLRETMAIPGGGQADTTLNINLGELILGLDTMSFATLTAPVVSAMMDLLASDGDTKLLQEPQVTTMNNSPANIIVGTSIPILVPQGEGSVFGTNPYTYQEQNIDISLDVLPRLNDRNVISLAIDASVQAIVGYVGTEKRPMVSTRSTNTNVRVRDGETLLIGGMIFDTDQETVAKFPLLGDLPIIKYFFRYTITEREQRELLIFITPTVVRRDS